MSELSCFICVSLALRTFGLLSYLPLITFIYFYSSYMLRLQGQKLAAYTRYKEERAKAAGAQRYKHIIIADLNVSI